MSDQFLKDIEADIAKLNAALKEDIDSSPDEGEMDVEEDITNLTTLGQCGPPATESAMAEDAELPDLDTMMKDHAALLLKIDDVLKKNNTGSSEQYSEYETEVLPVRTMETESEDEDYFKGMNTFVESEEIVDTEKLYDLLEVNLNYQDFLTKLTAELERRLDRNRTQQCNAGKREDDSFFAAQRSLHSTGSHQRSPCTRILSLQKFKPPYFNNHYKIGPRQNKDELRLSGHPRYQMYRYDCLWGKRDRNNLMEAIKGVIIEDKMVHVSMTKTKEEVDEELKWLTAQDRDIHFQDADIDSWDEDQWTMVAMTLSAMNIQRSKVDCFNQWKNYSSPKVSHEAWTKSEGDRLVKYVGVYGMNSWDVVANKLATGRKGWQCLQHYQKIKPRTVTQWSVLDDKQLLEAVKIYGDQSFSDLSYYMGDKESMQCLQRWRYSISPTIKRGKWTKEEDEQIADIIADHGFDWQKIKDVQKHRTRAQVKERIRILTANKLAGTNGGTLTWTVRESFELMELIHKHGDKNWVNIRRDLNFKYTAAVLFRRWGRIRSILKGTIRRIMTGWEKQFVLELLYPRSLLVDELQVKFRDLLPTEAEKVKLREILKTYRTRDGRAIPEVVSRMSITALKRGLKEEPDTSESEGDDPLELGLPSTSVVQEEYTETDEFAEVKLNAGKIYQQAFDVGEGQSSEHGYKLCYTPPSLKTVSTFKRLLCEEYPKLKEKAGVKKEADTVTLPEEVLASEEFDLLSARFRSLFAWPVIMGETPVI